MRLRPVGPRLVIKKREMDKNLASGLILPEDYIDRGNEGTVLRVSDEPGSPCKEGDVVVFTTYGGTELTLDAQKFLVIGYKNILGVLESA